MKKNFDFFVLLLLFFALVSNAQDRVMINKGEMYISKDNIVATYYDFENDSTGDFYNDGTFYLYANYNNKGAVDYVDRPSSTRSSGGPLTVFFGTAPQQISGGTNSANNYSSFYNVEFANNSGAGTLSTYSLDGTISVEGTASFEYGIVSNLNSGGEFIFGENATATNADDDSHVDGFVAKRGTPEFEYPVGHKGIYRPNSLGITSNGRFDSNYMFEKLAGDYKKHGKVKLVDENEYWVISSSTSDFQPSDLTLTWNTKTTPQEILASDPSTQIGVAYLNTASNQWEYVTTVGLDESNNKVTAFITKPGTYTLAKVYEFMPDDLIIYNDLMPGTGSNEYMKIIGIEFFPDNTMTIINRWGVKVYETTGYGQNDNWFRGYSEGNVTIDKKSTLPTGTYYYILKYKTQEGESKERSGYLYIN